MKKNLPYLIIFLALTIIVTSLYGFYLLHLSKQLVDNWMRIEQVSIQQGNIFSSLATSNRILLSSGTIKSVMLYDVQNNPFTEMASYGEYMTTGPVPDLLPGAVTARFCGPYQVLTFVKFRERPNLVAVFKTESSESAVVFAVILSILITIYLGFAVYIQRLTRAEESKRSARDRLIAQTSQMLGHDLRAPLGTFEQLLNMDADAFPAMKDPIRESLSRINAMVEALRNYELENIVHQTISCFDFVAGLESLRGKAERKGLLFQIPPALEYPVDIDRPKLERAWLNLANNAIEFANTVVQVEHQIEGADLILRVKDDGPGVSADILPRLFHRGATAKSEGTGLGLAYARQIARGHGGDVNYRREDTFTIFECRLPNTVVPAKEHSLETSTSPSKTVAICLEPDSLSQAMLSQLAAFGSEKFLFTGDRRRADVVVSNIDPVMFEVLERDSQEFIQVSATWGNAAGILSRLKMIFNLS